MLILKISIVPTVLVGVVLGIKKFNEHCIWRFGHAFFGKQAFYRTAVAVGLIEAGNLLGGSSAQHHGNVLGGLILVALGIGAASVLVYTNVKNTSLAYGLGGSVVQIAGFSVLAWISIPVLFIVLIWQFVVLSVAQPVYIVNR
jgi:hypothetical protein